ncbi:MAG TPA: LemA family protein [Nitrospirae bacterium]|nr:lemA family protein [bacterium BMS3Abin09]GBE41397.1 lemA family protein [bacterium BMS3Bbin09]HDZ84589.1 LemA family protein [Nitrospirota bacterium]
MSKGLKITLIVVGIILLIGFMTFSWFRTGYDNVVAMDENVTGKWAQVENQLKRRYDLIPNLIETVKGYAKHEKELFENIANARTKYFQAGSVKGKLAASGQLEGFLSRLLVLREAYPELKANQNFLKLQDSLEGTENRVSVARMRYNESVQMLNTYIRTFFGRFFASLAGVSSAEYYEIPKGEEAAPKVNF